MWGLWEYVLCKLISLLAEDWLLTLDFLQALTLTSWGFWAIAVTENVVTQ